MKKYTYLTLLITFAAIVYMYMTGGAIGRGSSTLLEAKKEASNSLAISPSKRPERGAASAVTGPYNSRNNISTPELRPLTSAEIEDVKRMRGLRLLGVDKNYSAMFAENGWDNGKRELFREMRVRRMEKGDRLVQRMMLDGNPPDKETVQVIYEQTGLELEAELKASFSAEDFANIQEFEATQPARFVVKELASALLFEAQGLAPQQATQLVSIIAANSYDSNGKININNANVTAIMTNAAAFLSAAQCSMLKQILSSKTGAQPIVLKP